MENLTFQNPNLLYLLLVLVPLIAWYVFKHDKYQASIRLSTVKGFSKVRNSYKYYLRHLPPVLHMLGIALLIIALARPQSTDNWSNTSAAKQDAIRFISGRPNDRIGLVIFSGESFTQCPLTTDHAVLINLINDVKPGMIEDGTAIGLGLANAVSRLRESKAISKVIILMTDGVNNQGQVPPLTAAEIAKTFGVRVYSIGVGSKGTAPYPVTDMFGRKRYQDMEVEIDEEVLSQIAQMTDGRYFRAVDNKRLEEVYYEIDKLEKSKIEVKEYSRKNEEYLPFLVLAGILLVFEVVLRNTLLRNIP
jgi:Ca-activated chloride channel family protein